MLNTPERTGTLWEFGFVEGTVYPPRYAICDEFLAAHEFQMVLEHAIRSDDDYGLGEVTHADEESRVDPSYRRSLVKRDDEVVESLFRERIAACAETVFERLFLQPLPIRTVLVEISATVDDGFFAAHTDDRGEGLYGRYVTLVYYAHRTPKLFSGGTLRLFSSRRVEGGWLTAADYVDIEPHANRLVLFPSFTVHEVRPVHIPSKRFEDGRFTVSGWLHV